MENKFVYIRICPTFEYMKVKTSHTLDADILQQVEQVMTKEGRPSLSNTIEFLIKKGLYAWHVSNGGEIEARKKKKSNGK